MCIAGRKMCAITSRATDNGRERELFIFKFQVNRTYNVNIMARVTQQQMVQRSLRKYMLLLINMYVFYVIFAMIANRTCLAI